MLRSVRGYREQNTTWKPSPLDAFMVGNGALVHRILAFRHVSGGEVRSYAAGYYKQPARFPPTADAALAMLDFA